MTDERAFPAWDELYREGNVERLPWYWPALDPDLDAALGRHGITEGRILDQGTGPGTQAIALAHRGFTVTGSDVSAAAVAYASRAAREDGVAACFVTDDVLQSRIDGPFDAVFDRGCFHVLAPAHRAAYAATVHRLLAPSGWLLVKTFSDRQPGTQGPYRFAPVELRGVFETRFDVVEVLETVYQGTLDPFPHALFASMRKRPSA